MRASELFTLLNKVGDGIPSDQATGAKYQGIKDCLQTVDMVLDSIPGAREFMEAHAEAIANAGPGGRLEFEDCDLSQWNTTSNSPN